MIRILRLSLVQMRHSARHLVAVCLATMIGVAFVTATLLVGNVLEGTLSNSVVWQFSGASAIVTAPGDAMLDPGVVDQIRAVDGVESAENRYLGTGIARSGGRQAYPFLANVPTAAPLRAALTMKDGRLPERPGEVAVLPDIAKSLRVKVGDTITFEAVTDRGTREQAVAQTVVGIIDAPDALAGIAPEVYGWLDDAEATRIGAPVAAVLVVAKPGLGDGTLVDRINARLGATATARTYAEQASAVSAKVSGGVNILGTGLLAFAGVALFVASIVIANTYTVLVAQRTRNLALLRCVGATRSQVRRSVLIEAVGIGLVASVLGIAVGIGVL
ncbi:MAG: FtsX-like permease family protein, partial [Thermomicrobiales bacterium]